MAATSFNKSSIVNKFKGYTALRTQYNALTTAWFQYSDTQANGLSGNYTNNFGESNLYINTSDDSMLSGDTFISGSSGFAVLAKYNKFGTCMWQRKLVDASPTGIVYSHAVTGDISGNAYIVGTCTTSDGFIAKYDSSGTIQWQRYLKDSVNAGVTLCRVVVDASLNVFVTGVTPGGLPFLAKYNSSGTLQWQRVVTTTTGWTPPNGLSLDSTGNIYMSCWDGLFKYNTSGVIQWQRKVSTSGSGMYGMSADSSGNCYVIMSTTYGAIAKYNSSGTIQWIKDNQSPFFGWTDTSYLAVSSDSAYVYVATNASTIMAKYSSAGAGVTVFHIGGSGNCLGLALDSAGDIATKITALAGSTVGSTSPTITTVTKGKYDTVIRSMTVYMTPEYSMTDIQGGGGAPGTGATLTTVNSALTSATSTYTEAAGSLSAGTSTLTDSAGSLYIRNIGFP